MSQNDRLTIRPKERFRKSLKDPAAFRAKMADPEVMGGVDATLAEMANTPGCSREMLNGAIVFAQILLNLSEPDQGPKMLPIQTLKASQ